MKILYDEQIFAMQKYGGISRYFAELMHQYKNSATIDFAVTARFTQNSYAAEYDLLARTISQQITAYLMLRCSQFDYFAPRIANFKLKLNQQHKEKLFASRAYDLFHPTYYDPYFLKLIGSKPFVLTVYDTIHEIFPEMYAADDPTSQWKRELVAKAAKIIAVSHSTKNDLIKYLGVDADKIAVVHHGASLKQRGYDKLEPAFPGKYMLFVGERIRYKNFIRVITAIAPLLKKDPDLYLVCAGGGLVSAEENRLFEELDVAAQVKQCTVADGLLAQLYANAQLFISPSLYEGFGMPVLEAFSCGCPVIVSNTSSFPEVAAEAALYIDPVNGESIRAGVETMLHDQEKRKKFVQAGLARARHFSWERTARETAAVYSQVV